MPRAPLAIFLALVLGLSALLAGCGGSANATVTPTAFVRAVCQAVGPFERDIQTRSSALNLSAITSAAQGKQELQRFLVAATADTRRAVAQLQAAGTPRVANGTRIATAIVGAFRSLSGALGRAAGQAAALPTTTSAAFRTAAEALGSSVRGSMGNIGAGLGGLRNVQLERAAQREPACTRIGQ